jgi:methanogenic corrinoid protein MtbC1
MSDDEIVLAELPDDELVKQMHDDLYDGLAEEIHEGTTILLARGWAADRVLNEALVCPSTNRAFMRKVFFPPWRKE